MVFLKLLEVYRKGSAGTFHKSTVFGNTIMTSQPVPNETVIVLPSNVITFSQAEKPEPTNQGQDSLKKRLQAEVKVIGTIQILCGVMVLSLGIILASASFSPNFTQVTSTLLNSAYPFIGPFLFIISGSLSIATEKRLTKLLVYSSLIGSILSALSALVGFIILSVELAALNPALLQCELDKNNIPTRSYFSHYYHDSLYTMDCYTAKTSLVGTLSLMLICTLLEFCLAVLTAVLWWKQAYSDFPGSVLFLPHSYIDNSGMSSKMTHGPGYEELLTS
ncbi:membrane-spanning 4-domains subfamily A member 6A isoform X3 [Piliocolobus tephrosceles]|uniref:membrane-spanning 4-domains subfamily A member 6A isoform X3 n=1 Tax=Piliocolobus tephrosceles TaxID=591936 RepID=UPI000E6B1757|nr:membrane-spanning 4-domains subfamily A member 6A isoform X3 [Piliocolobus tephrosceles]